LGLEGECFGEVGALLLAERGEVWVGQGVVGGAEVVEALGVTDEVDVGGNLAWV
jgi:hypothetical protein